MILNKPSPKYHQIGGFKFTLDSLGKDRITWPRQSVASNSAAPAARRRRRKGRLRAVEVCSGQGRQRPGSVAKGRQCQRAAVPKGGFFVDFLMDLDGF